MMERTSVRSFFCVMSALPEALPLDSARALPLTLQGNTAEQPVPSVSFADISPHCGESPLTPNYVAARKLAHSVQTAKSAFGGQQNVCPYKG